MAILLVLTACSDKTQTSPPNPNPDAAPPPGQSTPSIKFGVNEADALSSNPQPSSFNLLTLRELWFAYQMPSIGDVAVLRIKAIMPNGLEFGTYVTAYSLDQPNHMQVSVPGFSVPIDVRPAMSKGGTVTMTYGISVSGTDYQTHPYPGNWRVHVSIDGVSGTDVDATITFTVGQ